MATDTGPANAELLQQPPGEYRPMPFWGLNDRLDPDQLRGQIASMGEGGWGGFFVHPRYGLETPYLGAEYLERMKTIRDQSAAVGLQMWLYDEHPFPAGSAGGLVAADRPELRHQVLALNVHNRLTPLDEGVAFFAVQGDLDDEALALEQIPQPDAYRGRDRWFLHFYVLQASASPHKMPVQSNTFIHGFPYVDLLNPEASRRFIELTYEAYEDAIGDSFGTVVQGSFSDMPVYHWHPATPHPSVPWTTTLPEKFRDRYGYGLVGVLPSLFYDVGDYLKVRHDYWHLVSDLFVDSFTVQVADWCAEHGLIYTAHYWGEETLPWQVAWTGDVMHHFSHQHYVGNDHILRNIEDPIGIKQAATVAEQLGKPRTITETYALSGHNLSFEERKWIGDWEYALGSNFLVPYIPAYSMRGRRKRDEPPSQFTQQPYWADEDKLSTYFGRLGYLLTRGSRVVDVLLLQPLSTAWSLYRPADSEPPAWHPTTDPFEGGGGPLFAYSKAFQEVADSLLRLHYDFHLGNERLLRDHGAVENGRLVVGQASYGTIVVPPSLTWQPDTVRLVRDFVAGGGTVIALEPLPTHISGNPADEVLPAGVRTIPNTEADLAAALAGVKATDISIAEAPEVLYHHRASGDEHVLFLANTSLATSYRDVAVRMSVGRGEGALQRWDLMTGARERLAHDRGADGSVVFRLDFAPVSSHLVVWSTSDEGPVSDHARELLELKPITALDGPWAIRAHDANALLLDYCQIKVDDFEVSGRIPTWQAHEQVRRAGVGSRFTMSFDLQIRDLPDRLHLAVEDAERYAVSVNGVPVLIDDDTSRWWDPSLALLDIGALVRAGANTIEVAGRCALDTELEPVYVVGPFAVERAGRDFELTRAPEHVKALNLVDEGYPFYSGRVTLTQDVEWGDEHPESAYLTLGRLDAITAHVRINGAEAGFLAWQPYRVDIGRLLRPGTNTVEIELATSLHNLLGPHHDRRGEVNHFVIDRCWMDEVNWTDDYFFVPVGVTDVRLSTVAQ